jgi:streptogramin lyase
MTRLGMMLAAAIAIMAAAGGGAVYAKMAMQTFPVLAGAGAHDVYPAPDGTVIAGRKGEVWGAESAADKIFVLKAE